MRLKDERNALNRRSVGAFAALDEALLDEFLRVSEQGNALASIYLYRRTDLPVDAAGIEAARARVLASLRKRAPGCRAGSR